MTWTYLLVLVAVLAAAGLLGAILKPDGDKRDWPFYAKRPLSDVEQVLYWRLLKALPDHIVLAQVGMSRLVGVKKGHKAAAWANRIDRKSLDFVVCRKNAEIVAAIELDDASHQHAQRKHADATKDRALAAAGIRIIRWHAKSLPDDGEIRLAFEDPLQLPAMVASRR